MTVALSAGGDRAILTATGAMATLTAGDVPSALLVRARHVHVSSYFLMETRSDPGSPTLLAAARAAGPTHVAGHQLGPGGRWADQLQAILTQTDVLLPNEAEAQRLSGRHLDGAVLR